MAKAAMAKEGITAKAGGLQAPFGGAGAGAEGEERMEGQQQQPSVGFAAGLMMKAHSLKEGVKEKGAGINLGNVQGMTSMAGGVMGQVSGLIPGMKKEEEVPDPAAPAEGEYAEYTEEQQYAEQGYEEQGYEQGYAEEQYAQ